MHLKEIAEIFSGINYRQEQLTSFKSDIALLQAKDFDNWGSLKNDINYIESNNINSKFLLINKDILFAAKGNRNYSVIYNNTFSKSTASSSFFIIRVSNSNALPEYVSWFLNQKPAQDYFRLQSMGTFIPSINKKHLEEVDIPVPSLEIQRKVLVIESLRNEERMLSDKIKTKKDSLIEYCLIKKIKEVNE